MEIDELGAFERGVIAEAPPGALVVGASLSSDGAYGVAVTFLPSANYLMDDLVIRTPEGWEGYGGGSGGGISWTTLGDDDGRGVLRFADEAPEGVEVAVIEYEGDEYRVPVRHGHFLFVAWDTPFARDPKLLRFE